MLPFKVLLSLLCSTTALAKNVSPGFYSLHFDVSRGSSFDSASSDSKARLRVRDTASGSVLTELENESTFYSVDLKIGSSEQEVTVLVDTGSSDLWVTDSSNPYCSSSSSSSRKYRVLDDATFHSNLFGDSSKTVIGINKDIASVSKATDSSSSIDCDEYGTFDPSDSTSFHDNGTEFYILYGDNTFAYGTWGYDDVVVGGTSVENFSFAVANQTNSTVGVLGIGLEGLETTYSGSLVSNNAYTYANLPMKMVEDGLIHKRVYSLYLNDYDASEGNILFGGVDHAKYSGTLTTVPIINTLASSGYSTAIKIEVTLSSISSGSSSLMSSSIPALLDSGTTLTYIPSDAISSIADSVGASYSSSYGYYLMDCPSSSSSDNLTFEFDGASIDVPLDNFILSADSSGSTCVLALMDSGDSDYAILGDSFLRAAYLVYDLDELEVAMAPVQFTTAEDIEVVTSTIPSASAASGSSTASADDSDSSNTALNGVLGGGVSADSSDDDDSTATSGSGSSSSATASSSATSSTTNNSTGGASTVGFSVVTVVASLAVGLLAVL